MHRRRTRRPARSAQLPGVTGECGTKEGRRLVGLHRRHRCSRHRRGVLLYPGRRRCRFKRHRDRRDPAQPVADHRGHPDRGRTGDPGATAFGTGSGQMPVQPPQERTEPSVRVPSPRDDPVPAGLEPGPDPPRKRGAPLIPALHRPPMEEQRTIQAHHHLGMLAQPHHLLFRKRRAATPTLEGLLHPPIMEPADGISRAV